MRWNRSERGEIRKMGRSRSKRTGEKLGTGGRKRGMGMKAEVQARQNCEEQWELGYHQMKRSHVLKWRRSGVGG